MARYPSLLHISRWYIHEPRRLWWWTAVTFFVGALLFVINGILIVIPFSAESFQPSDDAVNGTAIVGAIFFVLGGHTMVADAYRLYYKRRNHRHEDAVLLEHIDRSMVHNRKSVGDLGAKDHTAVSGMEPHNETARKRSTLGSSSTVRHFVTSVMNVVSRKPKASEQQKGKNSVAEVEDKLQADLYLGQDSSFTEDQSIESDASVPVLDHVVGKARDTAPASLSGMATEKNFKSFVGGESSYVSHYGTVSNSAVSDIPIPLDRSNASRKNVIRKQSTQFGSSKFPAIPTDAFDDEEHNVLNLYGANQDDDLTTPGTTRNGSQVSLLIPHEEAASSPTDATFVPYFLEEAQDARKATNHSIPKRKGKAVADQTTMQFLNGANGSYAGEKVNSLDSGTLNNNGVHSSPFAEFRALGSNAPLKERLTLILRCSGLLVPLKVFRDTYYFASLAQLVGCYIYLISIIVGTKIDLSNFVVSAVFYWSGLTLGSVFFVSVSAAFTYFEQCKWYIPEPLNLAWLSGFFNLVGSVGFLLSALFGYDSNNVTWLSYQSCMASLWGSCFFMIASYVQMLSGANPGACEEENRPELSKLHEP